ncbi:RNA polymerase sigma factor [Candidatus Uabimicrobium sp. HlEnr_7]|uniref:RNA polymerase sigma factor n=1 Tax=Candidatus Uabimicrobium helgolandensis TaxID=3095367 RepID=UPI003558D5A2
MKNKQKIYLEYLVLNSQKGDSESLQILIEYWQSRLLKHAWYITADREAAQDIVQESWLAVMKSLRNLQDPSRFRSWIYQITTNKCIDWIRHCQRQKKWQSEVPKNLSQSDKTQNDTDEFYVALNSLNQQHKIVLSLYYLEEMSITEVAEILNLSKGTVKSRLYHAREKLKHKLKGLENG